MDTKEVKRLLLQYRDIVAILKDGGIIQSSDVVSGYGEYVACKKLNLKRAASPVEKGYDATDKLTGKKYEIKSRKATAWNKPTLFGVSQKQIQLSDYVIYIEFNNDWEVEKLLKIPTNELNPNKYNRVPITIPLVKKYDILN